MWHTTSYRHSCYPHLERGYCRTITFSGHKKGRLVQFNGCFRLPRTRAPLVRCFNFQDVLLRLLHFCSAPLPRRGSSVLLELTALGQVNVHPFDEAFDPLEPRRVC